MPRQNVQPRTFSSFDVLERADERCTSTSIAPCTTTGGGAGGGAGAAASRATHAAAAGSQDGRTEIASIASAKLTRLASKRFSISIAITIPTFDDSTDRDRRGLLYADVIGGVTTFFTMAYIVVVNPGILSTPGTGMPFSGALTATVLIASSMTLLMGLYAKLPFAVAPGMGLNAFFAFTIVHPGQGAVADGARHGVLGRRAVPGRLGDADARADRAGDPAALRSAAAGGIGLLLTFIGLRNAGLVVADPATIVRMGTLDHRAAFLLPASSSRRR